MKLTPQTIELIIALLDDMSSCDEQPTIYADHWEDGEYFDNGKVIIETYQQAVELLELGNKNSKTMNGLCLNIDDYCADYGTQLFREREHNKIKIELHQAMKEQENE